MKQETESYDVVVCGGGLAGFCAAIAAARHGAKTCLVHDRPVLGGNSSSEIGVSPCGAASAHAYGRAGGILGEVQAEERAHGHWRIDLGIHVNSGWDMALYDLAVRTPNLALHLNTAVSDVLLDREPALDQPPHTGAGYWVRPSRHGDKPGHIRAVVARAPNAEVIRTIQGRLFVDATGDGLVADLSGCQWRMGSEGHDEFGELHAPPLASTDTMGSTLCIKIRDIGRPVEFHAPSWAVRYDDPDFFHKGGRDVDCLCGGFWWVELGVPWHTIHDNETLRHELTRHALGVWDYIKNRDPQMSSRVRSHVLDWIGQVPGKRDSRRVLGLYMLNECDLQANRVFEDEVAFGGWSVDLHTPGGLLASCSEAGAATTDPTYDYVVKSLVGPFGIPLRSLIAADVDNLLLAGRDASVSHAAMGATRVQCTTGMMGQAAGTTAALALHKGIGVQDTPRKAIDAIQQTLLRDGCFLPSVASHDELDLARFAKVSASSHWLFSGVSPNDTWVDGGIIGGDEIDANRERLIHRRGQTIAVGADRMDHISVCLSNSTAQVQKVQAFLVGIEHIWDYRCQPGQPLAQTVLLVPPGQSQWVDWPVNLGAAGGLTPGRLVRLDLIDQRQLESATDDN